MERKKTTKSIGELKGRLLAFGGVYSNLQALEQLQQIAEDWQIPPSHILCTGDVVGYCAEPEASVQAIREWGIHCIAGNVEIQLREGEADCGCDFRDGSRCDTFSRQWYPYAQTRLSRSAIEWMQELPDFLRFRFADREAMVVHGSFHHTSEYVFASTPWAVKQRNFVDTHTQVILAGHCGLPFQQQRGNCHWLNPGVIGMPANDGTVRVWYMILEAEAAGEWRYAHQAFFYDHRQAAKRMRAQGLPESYAQTLETGIWDNCEILPREETEMQGVQLSQKYLAHF
ncbi:MAG: metallophosphoesterase family protein [Bacteroidota bacterium]